MPLISIIGAGPGLGLSLARRFGREGFTVALLARRRESLDHFVDTLAQEGTAARGYVADVTDPDALIDALGAVENDLGPLDILVYSPAPKGAGSETLAPVAATELTIASVAPQLEYYLYGGITAVQSVLPRMRQRGAGTILVTTGASSGPVVYPPFGNIAAASGALRNWVLNLHQALRPDGVYVAHIALGVRIGSGGPDSDPDRIADQYWALAQEREKPELFWTDDTLRDEE